MRLRVSSYAVAGLVVAVLAACATDEPTNPAPDAGRLQGLLGNGYPEGGHDYSLQIIGMEKGKDVSMDNNNGHRIFVLVEGGNPVTDPGGKNNDGLKKGGGDDQNQIYLCNSSTGLNDVVDPRCDAWRADGHIGDFGVIDANATDGDGGIFGLPDPCPDDNISTTPCTPIYSVWARVKALKPFTDGSVIITTCADETGAGFDGEDDVWCGNNGIELTKRSDHQAVNVSENLLFMTIIVNDATDPDLGACIDSGPNGTDDAPDEYDVYLFDNCFENYFWNYDNRGVRVLELRFFFTSSL